MRLIPLAAVVALVVVGCGSGARTVTLTRTVPIASSLPIDPATSTAADPAGASATGSFLTPGPPVIVTINDFRYRVRLVDSRTTVQPLDSDSSAPGFVHLEAEVAIENLQRDRAASLTWATNDPMDTVVFEATKQAAVIATGEGGSVLCRQRFCPLVGHTRVYLDAAGHQPGDVVDGYDLNGLPAAGSILLWYVEIGNDIRASAQGDQVRLTVDGKTLNRT